MKCQNQSTYVKNKKSAMAKHFHNLGRCGLLMLIYVGNSREQNKICFSNPRINHNIQKKILFTLHPR